MIFRQTVSCLSLFAIAFGLVACTTSTSSSGGNDGPAAGGGRDANGYVPSAKFFLPTGAEVHNTSAPSLEIDEAGTVHAVYPNYAGGGAHYATCPAECASEKDVKVVSFPTEGTVANAMLALTKDGKPRVLLSTFARVYFASCDANCSEEGSWQLGEIMNHGSDREITGEALALDPQGRPRFVMHTYKAYLGVGQKAPATWYMTCDANCTEQGSWKESQIAKQMYRGSALRIDDKGVAHLATITPLGEDTSGPATGAYLECASGCTTEEDWKGIGFLPAYESDIEAISVKATISLALTKDGAPRVAMLAKQNDKKSIVYFHCDADCTADHWTGSVVSDHEKLGAGLDLALDETGNARFAYTLDYNIVLAHCDAENCAAENAPWDLTKVEFGSDMPKDDIFLYPNCNVGAWFLHSPSLALTKDGRPRVGYQARDISGGWSNPDKTKPDCKAGTDMTLSRMSIMSSVK